MNESSVSSPFMKQLRERLPQAVVVKHHDASMIGLPDCSVTYNHSVWWLEFKFFLLKRRWIGQTEEQVLRECIHDIWEKSPTQWEMMLRMDTAATAFYIIWVKKTCVFLYRPLADGYQVCRSTQDAVQAMDNLIHGNTGLTPFA